MHTWIHAEKHYWIQGKNGCNKIGGAANDFQCTPLFPWAINMAGEPAGGVVAGINIFNNWHNLSVAVAAAFNAYHTEYDQFKVAMVRWTVHSDSPKPAMTSGWMSAGGNYLTNYVERPRYLAIKDVDGWDQSWMMNDSTTVLAAQEWFERSIVDDKKGSTLYSRRAASKCFTVEENTQNFVGVDPDTGNGTLQPITNSRPRYGWANCNPGGAGVVNNPAYILWSAPQIFATPFVCAVAGQAAGANAGYAYIRLRLTASICLAFRGCRQAPYDVSDQQVAA